MSVEPQPIDTRFKAYRKCTGADASLLWAAAGHGCKPAIPAEMRGLKATGATGSTLGLLLSVDIAMRACSNAGVAAPLLAAMAGVAGLQPYIAPQPQAQPVPVLPPSGVPHARGLTVCFHACHVKRQLAECGLRSAGGVAPAQPEHMVPPLPGALPPNPVPAMSVSQPHSLPYNTLAPAAPPQEEAPQQAQGPAEPVANSAPAEPGMPAAQRAADGTRWCGSSSNSPTSSVSSSGRRRQRRVVRIAQPAARLPATCQGAACPCSMMRGHVLLPPPDLAARPPPPAWQQGGRQWRSHSPMAQGCLQGAR